MILLFIILSGVVGGYLFLQFSPQFGSRDKAFSQEKMRVSENHNGRQFVNLEGKPQDNVDLGTLMDFFFKTGKRKPDFDLPVVKTDLSQIQSSNDGASLTWFGHSAVLIEIDGKNIFFDPMLGDSPSPISWLGGKRFNSELPLDIDDIPPLDAVIISHDHYDHLDYGSIKRLKSKVSKFFVPIGIGSHLIEWGVDADKITELDWWEEVSFDGIKIAATPARHFSGRSLNDKNATLWASWVLKGKDTNLFFSGDSGYTKSFKDIGHKYGPFDLAMVECGQYHEDWSQIHMMPEETVQATLDLKSKRLMPIHWGAFVLALHDWDDPVKRALQEAQKRGVSMIAPVIGETIGIHQNNKDTVDWWVR